MKLSLSGDLLEESVRNWFATLLVSARGGCQWAAKNLRTDADVVYHGRNGFHKTRAATCCSHWRWVFSDVPSAPLPFPLVCEELGLCENTVRRRILAQCRPNKDINRLVAVVLQDVEGK